MADHDHDHPHEHGSELSETQLRVRALETILTEKGYVDPAALDAIVETYETKVGPRNGSLVVAKAWTDPAFRQALLKDATAAVGTLGHVSPVGDHLVAVENTPQRHNMIVCTLCSCYPWEMLGLPPVWYKSAPYRSRAVKDPRGVLGDFGVKLPANIEIRVSDTGRGIEPAFLPHIFERFRQAGTGARRHGGLGLGLSIVRHIVEMHGGTVAATSEGIGRGTTFRVTLPIPEAEEAAS